MSQWDKLLARVLGLSNDLRFEEVCRILEHYGYIMGAPRSGSSHYTFRKPGRYPITIPKSKVIKRSYIELVRAIVEEEEGSRENAR